MVQQSIGDETVRKEELSLELIGYTTEPQASSYFL